MLEAAHHNCAILYGPSFYNFQAMHEAMMAANCAINVKDEATLEKECRKLLQDSDYMTRYQMKALSFAGQSHDILDALRQDILAMDFWKNIGERGQKS
jgi:3-deoxy-D-manno-octulosonic-acid transferase